MTPKMPTEQLWWRANASILRELSHHPHGMTRRMIHQHLVQDLASGISVDYVTARMRALKSFGLVTSTRGGRAAVWTITEEGRNSRMSK